MNKSREDCFWFAALTGVLLASFLGELGRVHDQLFLDLITPLIAGAWILRTRPNNKVLIWGGLFVAVGLGSLLINSVDMGNVAVIKAALYAARWFSLLVLFDVTRALPTKQKSWLRWALLAMATALAVAGFIQLKIKPDFTDMEILGWDPHQGRLLSTWFDPNFVGGFFAFILPWTLEEAWTKWPHKKSRAASLIFLAASGILALALLLTLSRSAYVAAVAAVGFWALSRSFKLTGALAALALLLVTLSPSAQSRILDLSQSALSLGQNSLTLPDPSARLRFGSWQEASELFAEKPLLGQGFNRYADAALQLGTLRDTKIHSASGSDSSLLNVLATTGLVGFLLYLTLHLQLLKTAPFMRFGLAGLLVHSIFVNSLFFPLLLAPFWILAGLKSSNDVA